MHPSHRASLHAPENTRLLWFSSHLIETGLSMPSGWVSRWIFMGDLVRSVHGVVLGVYSTTMLGSLLQNTKTLLCIQVCVIVTSPSLLNICEAKVFGDYSDFCVIRGDILFWETALFLCQRVLAALGIVFSFGIASCCWYVLVRRQGSKEWLASQWYGDGQFLPKEANAAVTAALRCREVWTCFGRFLAGQPLCSQPYSSELEEVLKPETLQRFQYLSHRSVLPLSFRQQPYFPLLGFFMNYLHPLPKSKMNRNHCTQTFFWYWVALAQAESNVC